MKDIYSLSEYSGPPAPAVLPVATKATVGSSLYVVYRHSPNRTRVKGRIKDGSPCTEERHDVMKEVFCSCLSEGIYGQNTDEPSHLRYHSIYNISKRYTI